METKNENSQPIDVEAEPSTALVSEPSTALATEQDNAVTRPPRPGEGRPTKYDPRYCTQIEDLMSGGPYQRRRVQVSLEFTRYDLRMDQSTRRVFRRRKRGEAKSQLYWERIGRLGANGGIKNFSAASWIFNMKNRFKWRDRVEVSNDPENPTSFVGLIVDAEKILAAVKKKNE